MFVDLRFIVGPVCEDDRDEETVRNMDITSSSRIWNGLLLSRWCVNVDVQRECQAKSSVVGLKNNETARAKGGLKSARLLWVQRCAE